MLADVLDVSYLPSGLSDHSPLLLKIHAPSYRTAALWRLGTHWLSHVDLTTNVSPRLVEYWEFNERSSSVAMIWDAFKAFSRGQYISSIAGIHREQAAIATALQQAVQCQSDIYTTDPTNTHFDLLNAAKHKLHLHLTELTRLDLHRNKQMFFEQGDRNGRLLAMLAQPDYPPTVIPNVVSASGASVSLLPDILEVFRQYYSSLYTSVLPSDFQPKDLASWLDPLALGWLSDKERKSLVGPITPEEVLRAIESFPQGKSPGPDGLLIEFYKTHGNILAPKLAQLYSQCLMDGALPTSMSHAHVILIHKDLKDPSLCASYRPIALLNTDLKILTKLLTIRLQPLLPSVVDIDQTGFMANRSTDVNLRRLFTNIHAKHLNEGTRVVASLDIEKAFDTIKWPFIWEVLRRMGFPLIFIKWIQIIYQNPTSAIKLGGSLSQSFSLSRGTRQGCPISPALFAIAMEPLAEALRTSLHVKGLRVGWLEERVALYADDLLLFLNDAGPSLKGALQVLNSFSAVRSLKVNWEKSLLFPIDFAARATADTDILLRWVEHFKYLGVVVSRQVSDYISLNLTPVIQETQQRLKAWESLPLSLLGRIHLIKMNVLPKFTYLFRHSPQWIPKSFFARLHRIFSAFIWRSKPPRYSWATLVRPTSQGGLACPDFHKYYLASQLVTTAWWLNPDTSNFATQVEAAVLESLEALKFLIFRGPRAPYSLTPSMLTTLRLRGPQN